MYIKKKKYPPGNIDIIVVEKINGKMNELVTIGIAKSDDEIEGLVRRGQEWIDREQRHHPHLDLFGEERIRCEQELMNAEQFLSNITNITIDGADLILDRVFDNVGFNRIEDEIFRKLVKARLSYPASKSATVEYLKNHFDDDVSLSKIYRYLDKLSDSQHSIVLDISVGHTRKILGDHIGVLSYDVTTLYFESEILPVVTEFVRKYELENFIVVADSGLMNNDNIADLEANGCWWDIQSTGHARTPIIARKGSADLKRRTAGAYSPRSTSTSAVTTSSSQWRVM